jgi:hypothetical protein
MEFVVSGVSGLPKVECRSASSSKNHNIKSPSSTLLLGSLRPPEARDLLGLAEIGVSLLALLSFGEDLLCLLGIPVIAERRELAAGRDCRFFDLRKHLRFARLRFDER